MITEQDIVRIAEDLGCKAGFVRIAKHSHCAKTPELVYVRIWRYEGTQRFMRDIGNITKIALLSRGELSNLIASKMSKAYQAALIAKTSKMNKEDKVEQGRH